MHVPSGLCDTTALGSQFLVQAIQYIRVLSNSPRVSLGDATHWDWQSTVFEAWSQEEAL